MRQKLKVGMLVYDNYYVVGDVGRITRIVKGDRLGILIEWFYPEERKSVSSTWHAFGDFSNGELKIIKNQEEYFMEVL